MTSLKRLFFVLTLLTQVPAVAQYYKDAGAWLGASVSYPLSKKLELGIAPECRLDENMSRVRGLFADVGGKYKLTDFLSVVAEYRGGIRRSNELYTGRHRLSIGLALKYDWHDFTFTSLTRNQVAPSLASGDGDVDVQSTIRQRLSVKYKGLKKIDLSYSYEWFLDGYTRSFTNWRTVLSADYKLSKRKLISVGYMIQQDRSSGDLDFVLQASYKWELKSGRKKDQTKSPSQP